MAEVLIGVQLLATGKSLVDQKRAGDVMEKRQQAQLNMEKVDAKRKALDQLARARALRAQAINIAEQTGRAGSSFQGGFTSATTSSAADNISYLEAGVASAEEQTRLAQEATDIQGDAAVFGAVASVSGAFAQATDAYSKVFGGGVKEAGAGNADVFGDFLAKTEDLSTPRTKF